MVEVKFYDEVDDSLLKFAVIIAKTNNKWVFCKHRKSVLQATEYISLTQLSEHSNEP